MKRWILYPFVLVAILALFGTTKPAFPADQMVLKIATISPEGTIITDGFKAASQEIEEKTGGRIKLKVYPGGVMGNDTVVMRKMDIGQLHGSTFTAGGISAAYSNYQIMSLPLLFNDYKEVDAVRKKIDPELTRTLEEKGYISFGIIENGFVYMMSKYPLSDPDDLRGRKVWIPEGDYIGRIVFEEAGVPPVPLPLPDVLTGLQTRLIDTVASSPVATVMLQWFTKVKYLSEYPLIYGYGTFAFSQKAWDQIPAVDRPIVRQALRHHFKQVDAQTRKDNQQALQTLKKQGLAFVELKPGSLEKMQQIADRAIDKLMQNHLFDEKMLAQIRTIIQSVRQGK